MSTAGPSDPLIDALAERIAPLIAPVIGVVVETAVARAMSALEPSGPKWADKLCNPYGSERAFLDAARRGDFETFRRARRVTALWVDVVAAIEGRQGGGRKKRPAAPAEPDVNIVRLVEEGRPGKKKRKTDG